MFVSKKFILINLKNSWKRNKIISKLGNCYWALKSW